VVEMGAACMGSPWPYSDASTRHSPIVAVVVAVVAVVVLPLFDNDLPDSMPSSSYFFSSPNGLDDDDDDDGDDDVDGEDMELYPMLLLMITTPERETFRTRRPTVLEAPNAVEWGSHE